MARLTVRWTELTGPPVNVVVGIDLVDQLIRDGTEQLVIRLIGANVDRAVRADVDSRATSMRTGWVAPSGCMRGELLADATSSKAPMISGGTAREAGKGAYLP